MILRLLDVEPTSRDTQPTVKHVSSNGVVNLTWACLSAAGQAAIQMASPATLAAYPLLKSLAVAIEVFTGYKVNQLAAAVDRDRARRQAANDLLANEHLARGLAVAIRERLKKVAASRTDAADLLTLADQADEWWPLMRATGIETIEAVNDRELVQRIAEHLTGQTRRGPNADEWRAVLELGAQMSALPHPLASDLLEVASDALATHFMHDAVEALKMDFVHSGEAFARVALTFFSEIHEGIAEIIRRLAAQETVTKETLDTAKHSLAAILDVQATVAQLRGGAVRAGIPVQLPRRPPAGMLIGRTALRTMLVERLSSRLDTDVVGPAGYGKTALAAEAIRDMLEGETEEQVGRSPYPHGIVLVDLYALRGGLNDAWSHLAQSFGTPETPNELPRDRARRACLGKRALVIVEGAEEAGASLGELLGGLSPESVRLVLTRDPAQATVAKRRLALDDELGLLESISLLREMSPALSEPVARRIHTALGGHPLALTWIGAALEDPTADANTLLAEIEAADLPQLHDPENGFETHTLKWLYDRGLRRLSGEERRVLAALACLAHAEFPATVVEEVLGVETRARALATLRALARTAFVARARDKEDAWTFTHALAYRFARGHDATREDVESLATWCEAALADAMSQSVPDSLGELRPLLSHADALLRRGIVAGQLMGLVGFLMQDVTTFAAQRGSTSIRRSAVSSAEALFRALPEEALLLSGIAWARSGVYSASGDIARLEGNLRVAYEEYEAGRAIVARLAEADPENAQLQSDLACRETDLGHVLDEQGEGTQSLAAYRRALAIRQRLVARAPADPELLSELADSENRIGTALLRRGDSPSALAAQRRAHEILETLAAGDPDNTERRRNVFVSEIALADALLAQSDQVAALEGYRRGLAIAERLAARDQTNSVWQRDLSISSTLIGDVLIAQGDTSGALAAYRRALSIRETLITRDPANTEWQRDFAISQLRIGNLLEAEGDRDGALDSFGRGQSVLEALAARDPLNTTWQNDVVINCGHLGDVLCAQGYCSAGLLAYMRGMTVLRALAARHPSNPRWEWMLVLGENRIADILRSHDDSGEALAAYRRGLAIVETLIDRDPTNIEWQRERVIKANEIGDLLMAQGDTSDGLETFRRGLALAGALAARYPDQIDCQRDVIVFESRLGDQHALEGHGAEALAAYDRCLKILEALAARDPDNTQGQQDLARCLATLASLFESNARHADAVAAGERSLTIREQLCSLDPTSSRWTQDAEASRALVARLQQRVI